MERFNFKTVKAMNDVFIRLNNLHRWTEIISEARYNELAKQGPNCIVAFFIACSYENEKAELNWDRFPKIAVYRAFQKVYVNFNTPEYIIDQICNLGEKSRSISRKEFNKVPEKYIAEQATPEFAQYLNGGRASTELEIYRTATKIATLVELFENKSRMSENMYAQKYNHIINSIDFDFPGVSLLIRKNEEGEFEKTQVLKVIQQISRLRNQNRWSVMSYTVECSVLGHLFDTAVFAWIMSLEQNPDDEKLAAKMFFMGIFHDVAETWTTDIPSPIKDSIPGFRKLTEEFEAEMLEKHLFGKMPEYIQEKLHEVMFEEKENEQYFSLVKGADYLSADSECFRQYHAGSRDAYFKGAVGRREKKIATGEVLLTPACAELFEYFKNAIDQLQLFD